MLPVIKGYVAQLPALRPLVLVLKAYMAVQNLNSPAFGGLGSYALIFMIITFLKVRKLTERATDSRLKIN